MSGQTAARSLDTAELKQVFAARRPDDIAEAIIYFMQQDEGRQLPGATHLVHEGFAALKANRNYSELLADYAFRPRPVTLRSELLAEVVDDFQRTYSSTKPNPDMKTVELTGRGLSAIKDRMPKVLEPGEIELCRQAAADLDAWFETNR